MRHIVGRHAPYSPSARKRFSTNFALTAFSKVRPRVALLLDHRLGRLRSGYGVCMSVHDLPGALFGSKDYRDSQSERRYIFTSADLSLHPLYLHHVGKLGSYKFLDNLDANEIAISDLRCGTVPNLSNFIPSTHGRAKGVCEGYVFSMGPELIDRLGVAFQELI